MRTLLVMVVLCGCDLYFAADHPQGDPVPLLDAASSSGFCGGQYYYCRDGAVFFTEPVAVCPPPTFEGGAQVATCPYGCRLESRESGALVHPDSLCAEAPPPTYACTQTGTCSGSATMSCDAHLACGVDISVGTCTCANGAYACAAACSDGLCSVAAVQQAIAGVWHGTVTPPSFADPYTITLVIQADGRWVGKCDGGCIPFYYGDNGGIPGERIFIQAQTTTGAFATVRLFEGSIDGLLENVRVDAHHLSFTMMDSWLDCVRPFAFDLSR